MTRIRLRVLWMVLLISSTAAGRADAEQIELVTYFPVQGAAGGGAGNGDGQFDSLRVGTPYAGVPVPADGTALIFDSLGIGIPVPSNVFGVVQPIVPVGALEVRGMADMPDQVVFVPGEDTAFPGAPVLNVGIGTANPAAALALHVVQDRNNWAQVAGVFDTGGAPEMTVGQSPSPLQSGRLVYTGEGAFTGGSYHRVNQFEVVAHRDAVNGLALATDANAPIRFVTNGAAAGNNERMRIAGNGNVGIGTNNPQAPLQVGAASLFVQADQGGSLEIGGNNAIANPVANGTPYIDFHFGRVVGAATVAEDFNARLINAADGRLDVQTSVGGAAAETRLSVGANVGVGTAAPQPISPNGANNGNLDVNDLFLRSRAQWFTQIVHRLLGTATVPGFADGPFVNFTDAETVIGQITVTATGRPVLITVSYIVCNGNNGQRGYANRVRRDGTGVNGAVLMRHGGGVEADICEGSTLVVVDIPPAGQHTYYFNLWNGTNNQILRGQATQINVLELGQ